MPATGRTNEYPLDSFAQLCHDNTAPGPAYAAAVSGHAAALARLYIGREGPVDGRTVIVSIPRGGVPTGAGLQAAFNEAAFGSAALVESRIKTAPDALFPAGTFENTDNLVLADGVIGTGKTIVDHLKQIPADWQGRVFVFSNSAAEIGLSAIHAQAAAMAQPVASVTGRIFSEDECQWVQTPAKPVYYVGYNAERQIDFRVPDIGDHIQPQPPRLA